MSFYIRKVRKVINGVPITVMEKTSLGNPNQNIGRSHGSLSGLLDNDHPQYTLSSDTLSYVELLSSATNEGLAQLRSDLESGLIDLTDSPIIEQIQQANSFFLAGLSVTEVPPSPDDILTYAPETDSLIWRNIFDILADGDFIPETLESDIADSVISELEEEITTNYLKTKVVHIDFNAENSGIDPIYPTESHGIQWNDFDAANPLQAFYAIDVGGGSTSGSTDFGYHWTAASQTAIPTSDLDGLAMRFTMVDIAGRGWIWSTKGGGGPNWEPQMGLTTQGDLFISRSLSFIDNEPTIYTFSNVDDGKHEYALVYDSGTSAITLQQQGSGGTGGVSDHGLLDAASLLDNDHPQYVQTGSPIFLDATGTSLLGPNFYLSSSEIALNWTGGSAYPTSFTGNIASLSGAILAGRLQLLNAAQFVPDLGTVRGASIDWYDSGTSIRYLMELDEQYSEDRLKISSFDPGGNTEYFTVWDRGTQRVGILTGTPEVTLHVGGKGKFNDDLSASSIVATADLYSQGNLYLNHDGPDGDTFIYFYDNSSETGDHLKYDEVSARFEFSTGLYVDGQITTTSNVDLVGSLYHRGTIMYMHYLGPDSDQYMYWYDKGSISGQYIKWDDALANFVFSTGVTVNGPLISNNVTMTALTVENDVTINDGSFNLLTSSVPLPPSASTWSTGLQFAYDDPITGGIGWWGAYGVSPTGITYLFGGISYNNAPLKVDTANSRVGVNIPGTLRPTYTLDVYGNARINNELVTSGDGQFGGEVLVEGGFTAGTTFKVGNELLVTAAHTALNWQGQPSGSDVSMTGTFACLSGTINSGRLKVFNSLVDDLGPVRGASIDWHDSGASDAYYLSLDEDTSEQLLVLKSLSGGGNYNYLQTWDRANGTVGINERYPTETFTVCGTTLTRGKLYAGGSIYVNYEDLGDDDGPGGAGTGSKIFFENAGTFETMRIEVRSGQFFFNGGDANFSNTIGVDGTVYAGVGNNPSTTDTQYTFGSSVDRTLTWDASEGSFVFNYPLQVQGYVSAATLTSTAATITNALSVGDYAEVRALMIEFDGTEDWSGIQWGDSGNGSGKTLDGGQSIHVTNTSGNTYGDVTGLSMRFMMDATAGRGWTWTKKLSTYPVAMSLSNNGQLAIRSGITFVEEEPFFNTSATTADDKEDYVMAYDSGSSQVKLQSNENSRTSAISVMFDGGGAAIEVGATAWVSIPFDCRITEFVLLADQTGSIAFDVQVDSYANYPVTAADSITATTAPTISSDDSASGVTDAWTSTVSAGDIVQFSATSVATIEKCLASLTIIKDL